MLEATYAAEIPASDYRVVIALLDNLMVSRRGIAELMRRFTSRQRSQIVGDVADAIQERRSISEAEYIRVEQLLGSHGYQNLSSEPSAKWPEALTSRDPQEPSMPLAVRRCWAQLVSAFPNGIEELHDYVGLLQVLRDEQFSAMEIELLLSELGDRPKELVVKDIAALSTTLIVTEDQKSTLRRRLGLEGDGAKLRD
jgi:hypothetical protein